MERDGNDSVLFENASRRQRWRSRSPTLDPLSTFWRSPLASNRDSPRVHKTFSFDYFEAEPYPLDKRPDFDLIADTAVDLQPFPIVFEARAASQGADVKPMDVRVEPLRKKDSVVLDVDGQAVKGAPLRGLKKQIVRVQNFWKRATSHQPNVFQRVQVLGGRPVTPAEEEESMEFEDSIHRFTGDSVSNGIISGSDDPLCIVMIEDFSNKLICYSERVDDIAT